jgi:zinc protease
MSMLKIDQEAFDTERKVVEEERRMGVNQPYGELLEKVLPEIFPNHPYQWSPIGSIPHLRAASTQELRDFWTRYYVPNNATLVIVGGVSHTDAQRAARTYFGWIPRYDDPRRVPMPAAAPLEGREVVFKEKNAPTPIMGLLYRGVPLRHKDYTALQLMTTILGGGESSRLYRRIVAEEESAVMAAAMAMGMEQNGVIAAGAVMPPFGGDADKLEASLRQEINRMRTEPVSEAELTKAKNQMLKGLVLQNLTVVSKARALGSAAVLEGDVSAINDQLNRIRAITVADIQRVADQYLAPEHAMTAKVERNLLGSLGSLLGFKGGSEDDAPITAEPETEAPAPGRDGIKRPEGYTTSPPVAGLLDYDPTPKYSQTKLSNGLPVLVVENHEVPFVSVQLGMTTGAWAEAKPGTASMAFQMITKGSAEHTEAELAEELETYAVALSGSTGMDSCSVTMSCLPEHTDRGLRLMAEVVRTPTMPEDEFGKLRSQVRTGLAISANEPSYLADRELRRRLYGDHPYARTQTGELADVDALEIEDLRAWWQQNARPDVATLIFAGDVDIEHARQLAEKYFGDWQAEGAPPQVALPQIPAPAPTHIYLVNHQGVQSQIRVGQRGFTRSDPGYFSSRVVNGYFGGAFSARLNDTIRVKKGLTYGARGGFDSERFAGDFSVSTFSKNATTVEAVQAIFEELARLKAEPPSDEELNQTKSYTVGSFPSQRETPQQVAGQLWSLKYLDLPADYFERLLDGVANTTAEDCVKLARDKVDAERMVVVVVGPAAELREGLEAIAPVTVVEE